MLDIVVHQNFRVSEVIVSDILDSDHLRIVFHILDHVKIRNLSELIEKFTDWDRFQSLASDLISPRIKINSGVEADNAFGSRGGASEIPQTSNLPSSRKRQVAYRSKSLPPVSAPRQKRSLPGISSPSSEWLRWTPRAHHVKSQVPAKQVDRPQ
jgi:hypothetical protein